MPASRGTPQTMPTALDGVRDRVGGSILARAWCLALVRAMYPDASIRQALDTASWVYYGGED